MVLTKCLPDKTSKPVLTKCLPDKTSKVVLTKRLLTQKTTQGTFKEPFSHYSPINF